MQKICLSLAAGLAFGLAPWSNRVGPVLGALLLLAVAIVLSVAASGTWSALAAAGGALGAFGGEVLSDTSPALGGAVLVGLCYAERTMRVRGSGASRAPAILLH